MKRPFGRNARREFAWAFVPLLLLVSPAGSTIAAELQQAQVTRIIKDVRLLPTQAVPRPAAVNDTVRSDTAVRTGDESRTELTFTDQTLARLGANTIFTFNEGTRNVDLGTGVMLLHVPKGAGGAKVSTAAVTAAVTGTTVLIEAHSGKYVATAENSTQHGDEAPIQFGLVRNTKAINSKVKKGYVKFISLEGTARVFLNGHPEESVVVHPGQMLILAPGAKHLPGLVEVDLKKLVETCLLITDFAPLASEPLIAEEIRKQEADFDTEGESHVVTDPTSGDVIDQAFAAFPLLGGPSPLGTTVIYLGLPAGLWSSPASWNPMVVPNNTGGKTFNAVINSGNLTQDIAPGVTIQQLQMTGGILVLANPLTLNAGLQFSGGTITAGNLSIAGPSVQSAVMGVDGTNITNNGAYDITFDSSDAFSGGGSTFVNSGTLRKTTGMDVITFNMPIDNSGTVSVLNGAFSFTAGGTNSGILSAAAGAGLNFASDFSMSNGTRFTGSGFVTFSDGTVTTMSGTITNTATLSFNSAGAFTDLVLNGNVTLTGGGVVNLSGADRILGNGIFTSNNTIQGETSSAGGGIGQNQIGIVVQTGGVIDANVSGLNLDVDPNSTNGLVNQGTMRASNGGILLLDGSSAGVFDNSGGLITALNGSQVQLVNDAVVNGGTLSTSGTGVILIPSLDQATLNSVANAGALVVSDSSSAIVSGTINNTGSISLQSSGSFSDLVLAGNVTLTGGGTVNFANGASIDGNGVLTNVNNTLQGETSLGAASIGGTQIGIVNQVGGIIDANAPGVLVIAPSAAGGLVNQGTMQVANGSTLRLDGSAGATFNSSGTIQAATGGTLEFTGAVTSSGLVDVNGGSLNITGTGSYTQTAGTFRMAGGSVVSASTLDLQGGLVDARGSITAAINSGATIRPALGGTGLGVIGNVTLLASSNLSFQLGGLAQGSQYGFLIVNGTVALGGNLVVSFANGFQNSVTGGDAFTIATASGGLTGIFANIASGARLNTSDGFGSFVVTYSGNDIILANFLPPALIAALWTGGTGNWSDPTQWDINPNFPNDGQPGPGDMYSASLGNGGTIMLNIPITIENFTLSNGTVMGANSLTVNQLFTWEGGTVAGGVNLNANGGVLMSGGAVSLDASTLNNAVAQTATLNGAGQINFFSGAIFNNNGTFLAQNNLSFSDTGGGGTFNNTGTFTRNTGAGTFLIGGGIVFNNTGTVNVQTGTLQLSGGDGGSTTGDFNVSAGAVLRFDSNFTFAASSDLMGAGTATFSNGTQQINGTYTLPAINVSGATTNLNTATSVTTVDLSNGTLGGGGNLTISGLFNWTGGTMTGSGVTNANGGISLAGIPMLLIGRTLNNAVGQTATMGGGAFLLFQSGAIFNNNGTFLAQSDTIISDNGGGGTFNNAGTFTRDTGVATFSINSGIPFNNTGTVNVNSGTLRLGGGGTSTGSFSVNGATLNFSSGTYNLNASTTVTGTGTVQIGGSATWNLNAGLYNVTGATTVSGGAANFNIDSTTNLLNVSGGTLGGTGNLTSTGLFTWAGGTMTGTGAMNANGGVLLNNAQVTLDQRTLNNAVGQTFTMSNFGEVLFKNGGVINNNGLFLVQTNTASDGFFYNSGANGTFNNNGTFTRDTFSTSFVVTPQIAFNNAGTVNANSGTLVFNGGYMQTAGTTQLGGGNISSTSPLQIQGGLLTGFGTISAAISNNAMLKPGLAAGGLNVNGNLGLMGASSLIFQIGGLTQGSQYGFLNVTGAAALGGNLVLSFANGFQNTVTGANTFTIAAVSGAVTGIFANIASGARLDTSDGFGSFQVAYGGNTIVLSNYLIASNTTSAIWTGGAGNWSNATNWSSNPNFPNNGQPGAADLYDATLSNGGTITLDIPVTIEHFTLTSGTVTGPNNLTINQLFTWNTGTVSGGVVINANGGILFNNNVAVLSASTVNNPVGQTVVTQSGSGAGITLANGAIFNNNGTFFARSNGSVGGNGTFNNAGTFTRDTSAGNFVFIASLNNTGTFNMQTGTMQIFGNGDGGSTTGDFNVSAGATLTFASDFNFTASSDLAGAGTIIFSGTEQINGTYTLPDLNINSGTTTANIPLNVAAFNFDAGTLSSSGTVNMSGLFHWQSGRLTGGGMFNANGGIQFLTSNNVIDGATLNNAVGQTATMSDPTAAVSFRNGAVFNNSGTFLAENNLGFTSGPGTGTFNNSGTFTRDTAVGIFSMDPGVTFNNTGTLNINSGTIKFNGPVTSSGAINVNGGTFNLASTFMQTAGAITLSSGTLAVGGNASANLITGTSGTINVAAGGSLSVATGFDFSGSNFPVPGSNGGNLMINAPAQGIGGINNFNGADSPAPGSPAGGGGTLTVNTTTGNILVATSLGPPTISATTGIIDTNDAPSGAGGTVTLASTGGTVGLISSAVIQVSSSDPVGTANRRSSARGGNINLQSARSTGSAISINSTAQLLSLLENAAPGPGGLINIQATSVTGNPVITVGGTVQADRGGIDVRNSSDSGQINTSALMMADIIKVATLGDNSTLNIGGGPISAITLLRLYAGSISASNNSTINFTASCSLTGAEIDIAAHTVNIVGAGTMVMTSSQAQVYATVANYQGSGGTGGGGTGTFTGAGATTLALLSAPPLGPPGMAAAALPPAALSNHHSDIRASAPTIAIQNQPRSP